MSIIFWICIALIFYVIIGYPIALWVFWTLRGKSHVPAMPSPMTVNFLIPAHNEAAVIVEKIENTLALDNTGGHDVTVLVVSDGSTDDTVARAQSIKDPRLKVMQTDGRLGKLKALNLALEGLTGDIIVFSDANALLTDGTLDAIMRPFSDEKIGGVCGQITVNTERGGAIAKADAWFWRYDQWMKRAESELGGVVSAQGSIYAMRRNLTGPIPPGFADDFLMSVRGVEAGYKLAFAPGAQTCEVVSERANDEMSRRVRSTEMGWRGLMRMRHMMNPWTRGFYGWQLLSHKGLRRLTPLFLLGTFVSNLALMGQGTGWALLGLGQIAFYGTAIAAALVPGLRRLPLVPKVMFFCMGNLAMALGILKYYRGIESSIWTPVRENQ